MKNILFLILMLGGSLVANYAIAGPEKDSAYGNVMYTDASKEVAFDAACTALQKLGYKIETKDKSKFFVKGSYHNAWTGRTPLYAEISISQEKMGTKIAYSVEQPGAIKALDVTNRSGRFARNICRQIERILAQGDIAYRKHQDKLARELSEEDTRPIKHRSER